MNIRTPTQCVSGMLAFGAIFMFSIIPFQLHLSVAQSLVPMVSGIAHSMFNITHIYTRHDIVTNMTFIICSFFVVVISFQCPLFKGAVHPKTEKEVCFRGNLVF